MDDEQTEKLRRNKRAFWLTWGGVFGGTFLILVTVLICHHVWGRTYNSIPLQQATFVASVNSKLFHKPECRYAVKISSENLQTFATRLEAIEAGKTPCRYCRP